MDAFFLVSSLFLGFLIFICLYRIVFGPTIADRIVSIGSIGVKATAMLILIGMIYGRVDMFVDIALAYALLNFIATLASAKFFMFRKSMAIGLRRSPQKKTGEVS
jgi:multicomponent Na+:H+ antiporter subunit F